MRMSKKIPHQKTSFSSQQTHSREEIHQAQIVSSPQEASFLPKNSILQEKIPIRSDLALVPAKCLFNKPQNKSRRARKPPKLSLQSKKMEYGNQPGSACSIEVKFCIIINQLKLFNQSPAKPDCYLSPLV